MDYAMEASYANFVIESHINKLKMEAYIQECMVISEGTNVVPRIRAIHEDVGDKIKEGWNKFTAFIQRIWAKFVENMTRLFNTDHGYLEKYKDIILGKKIKDGTTYEMPEYNIGLQRIASKPIPMFGSNMLNQLNEKDDTNIQFKKTIISDYNGKTDWTEFCNAYFKGAERGNQSIEPGAIKMVDLYNFCINSEKIRANIEKDRKTLENAAREAETQLGDLIKKIQAGEVKAPTGSTATNTNDVTSQDTKPEEKPAEDANKSKNESFVYSSVFESYVSEDTITIGDSSKPNTNPNAATNAKTAATSGGSSSLKANSSQNIDSAKYAATKTQDTSNVAKMQSDTLEAKMKTYRETCLPVIGAKMNAVRDIHKGYMQIIKAHVSSYAGKDDAADNVIAQAGTDYAKTNRLPELNEANKAALTKSIQDAEKEQDQDKREQLETEVIQKAKAISKNFKGNYNDAKSWAGYTGDNS